MNTLAAAAAIFAQLAGAAVVTPRAVATQTNEKIVLDGRLDDAAWQKAPSFGGFTQKFPNERTAPASGVTTFKVLYDDDAVYFGIDCEQKNVPVVARLTRRDRQIESDRVTIGIDARGDGRSALELGVNAAGVLTDAIRFDDTEQDRDWDETWDARTARTEHGWSAEIKVPIRILRFSSGTRETTSSWGLQVRRYTSLLQETDEWAYIPRSAAGEVSRYGRLEGISKIHSAAFIELRPFVVGKIERADPGTETLRQGTKLGGSLGIDTKWHARSDYTLDLSILPDFAQVEADRLILNLTNEEVLLPEKRPFFFEGRDIFATPLPLLYTRRIGRIAPEIPSNVRAGEQLVDPTTPATLLGATKGTGRLREGLRVGSLSAITNENTVTLQDPSGRRYTRPVEPRTLFQMVRLRQELPGNATAGVFASSVVRAENTSASAHPDGLCPDGDSVRTGARCTHDAYVGAVDGRWRSQSGDYSATGQVASTVINNGPPRQLRDGTIIRSGDPGIAGMAKIAKQGGVPLIADVTYQGFSRKVDFNDMGFMRRGNMHFVEANVEYRTLHPWSISRETHTRLEMYRRTSTDGLVLGQGGAVNTWWRLNNFWEFFVEVGARGRRFDDREVGDGTALERREVLGYAAELYSDNRKPATLYIGSEGAKIFDGVSLLGWADGTVRMNRIEVSLMPQIIYAAGEPRFAGRASDGALLVFGKQEATELSATLRATYTFTPRLSLVAYSQLFFSSGHYSELMGVNVARTGRGRVVHRDELTPLPFGTTIANPDFENAALNANIVLRWEYLLGSTLFLVYTRTQSPAILLGPAQRGSIDVSNLGRAPAVDTFLLKLTYFFG